MGFFERKNGQFARKTSGDRFGGVNAMKNFLDIDEIPLALDRSFKVANKLRQA